MKMLVFIPWSRKEDCIFTRLFKKKFKNTILKNNNNVFFIPTKSLIQIPKILCNFMQHAILCNFNVVDDYSCVRHPPGHRMSELACERAHELGVPMRWVCRFSLRLEME
jgi:hypothetical protein